MSPHRLVAGVTFASALVLHAVSLDSTALSRSATAARQVPALTAPPQMGSHASNRRVENTATTLADLPSAAQAAISGTLGRDRDAYHAVRTPDGWEMRNPAHGMTATFTPSRRTIRAGEVGWGLRLRAYGRGDALTPVPDVAPSADANRVEYRRRSVAEWYVDGPMGLEQGFTLLERPVGTEDRVRVEVETAGDLRARSNAGDTGLTLVDAIGRPRLRYRGLTAQDANGRRLPASLEVVGPILIVSVIDLGARYPLVVDPMFESTQLLSLDASSGDHFGSSVAVDGDTIVIGAPFDDVPNNTGGTNQDQGSAYVFRRNGTTSWTQQQIKADDGAAGDFFGAKIAIDGDTIVVGAPDHDVPSLAGPVNQGSVYVFTRSSDTWSLQAQLISPQRALDDGFGNAVAIDDDTIVVGVSQDDVVNNLGGSNEDQGSAYVFIRIGSTWAWRSQLIAFDGAEGDHFGNAVAIDGDTIVVGASLDDVPNNSGGTNQAQGSARVFTRSFMSGGPVWTPQAQLTADDGAPGDFFGGSVALDGDTIVVGSSGRDLQAGSAYVFIRSGPTWIQQAQLMPLDDVSLAAFFGASVDIDGDTIVVGGPWCRGRIRRTRLGVRVYTCGKRMEPDGLGSWAPNRDSQRRQIK